MSAEGRKTASALAVGDRILVEVRGGKLHSTRKKRDGVTVVEVTGKSGIPRGYAIETDHGTMRCGASQTFGVAP